MHCLDALRFCDQRLDIISRDERGRFVHCNIFDYCVYPAMLCKPDVIQVRPLTHKTEADVFCSTELPHFLYLFKPYKAVLFVGGCLRLELILKCQRDNNVALLLYITGFKHLCYFAVYDDASIKDEFVISQMAYLYCGNL